METSDDKKYFFHIRLSLGSTVRIYRYSEIPLYLGTNNEFETISIKTRIFTRA